MRATRAVVGAVALFAALAIGGAWPRAQVTGGLPVRVDQEPMHREVFSNGVVAVLDVRFPPGYTSLFHTHSNDNVSVRIETGPTRTDMADGSSTSQTAPVGRLVFNSATPPYTHRLANLGGSTVRIVDVEILATAPTPVASQIDDLIGHEVVVENARVRLSRVVVPPGGRVLPHTHARGRLQVVVRGADPGSFVWVTAGAASPVFDVGPGGGEYAEVEIK